MGKVYIEAQYRIKDSVFNSGYVCIDGKVINCLFSLDFSYIKIINGSIHFYIDDYEPLDDSYYETEEFVGNYHINTLEYPYTYILKNETGNILSLKLIKKVYDPILIRNIEKDINKLFGE